MPVQASLAAALADLPLGPRVSAHDLAAIERRLASLDGVRRVCLSMDQRRARIGFDPAQVTIEALRQATQPLE